MLSSSCAHYGPAGISRPRPDSARPRPLPLCNSFSPPATAMRGSLRARVTIALNQAGRNTTTLNQKRGASAGFGYPAGKGACCALRNWRNSPVLRSGNEIMVFSVLLVLLASSCNLSNKPKLPKPPFETPINLAHEGVVADFDIRVTWHNVYYFEIYFKFLEGDQAERAYVQKLVGGLHEPKRLIPTPIKLTIFKKKAQGEQVVYQKTIEDPDTDSFSVDYFAKTIGHCNLPRGKYRFVLESLAQQQEYASIPTLFHIGTDPKSFFIPINIDRSMSCPQ